MESRQKNVVRLQGNRAAALYEGIMVFCPVREKRHEKKTVIVTERKGDEGGNEIYSSCHRRNG